MSENTEESAPIERSMRAKRTRRTIVRKGDVEIELIPAGIDGHDGWKLKLPPGTTITHLPMPNDNPRQT